jgi:hypothetical protein
MIIFLVDFTGKISCHDKQYVNKIIESKCIFKTFKCIDHNAEPNIIDKYTEIIDVNNQTQWLTNIKYHNVNNIYKIIACPEFFSIDSMCNKYNCNIPCHNKNVMIYFDKSCDIINAQSYLNSDDLIRCDYSDSSYIDEHYTLHNDEQIKSRENAIIKIEPCDVVDSLVKIMGLLKQMTNDDTILSSFTSTITNDDVIKLSSYVSIISNCIKKYSENSHNANKSKCIVNYMVMSIKKQIISILVGGPQNNIDIIKSLECICNKLPKRTDDRFINRLISNKLQFDKDINEIQNIIENDVFIDALDKQSTLGDKIQESTEFYKSYMTLTDWHEETIEGGCMGILFNMNVNAGTILIHDNAISTIQHISTTIIPIKIFIDQISSALKISTTDNNDLNVMEIIKCSTSENGNCLYPLYITKQHWDISKQFIKPLLGINLGKNPYNYDPSYEHFMFSFLMSMLDMTLYVKNVSSNDQRWIQMFLTVMRTCYQISIENNYNKGIIKLMDSYHGNTISGHKKCFHGESFYGQLISTGIIFSSNEQMSKIKTIILNDYKNDIKKIIKKTLTNDDVYEIDIQYILDRTKCMCDERFKKIIMAGHAKLKTLINFYYFTSMFNKFMKFHNLKSWKIIVKMLDMRFGIFPEHLLKDLQIKINEINKLIQKNLCNSENEIQLYNNFTKIFNDEINMHDIFVLCYAECYNLEINKQSHNNKHCDKLS